MKKSFLTGLVTLLPVALSIWFCIFIVHFLTNPFVGIVSHLLKKLSIYGVWVSDKGIKNLSEILILVGLFLLTLFIGLIARRYFFDALLKIGDKILYRIPLVNKVYRTSKEIIRSLFDSQGKSFQKVALLRFPYGESYCLGLVVDEAPTSCGDLLSVFIPTTPNPMAGFLVMVPKDHLIYLEMKSDEAIQYVISCAAVQPKGS